MANPQVENGHLKIANEIWEHIITSGMTASELPIAMAVLRKTWGWNKKQEEISLSEFQEITKQPERTIAHSLKNLIAKNILKKTPGGGRGNSSKWSFNKDWETWKTLQPIADFKTLQPIAENNGNSATHCSQTLQPIAENPATHCRVSTCKPMKAKEQLAPKATIKAIKDIKTTASLGKTLQPIAENAKDAAYEEFASEFKIQRTIPYRNKQADFVHLAALRRALEIEGKGTPPKWQWAIKNYFASTLSAYTLADLCVRYDCFVKGRLDRFGKPAPAEERALYDFDETRRA
jgi:phage replication O-like protein O